jgi:hypothetical protein
LPESDELTTSRPVTATAAYPVPPKATKSANDATTRAGEGRRRARNERAAGDGMAVLLPRRQVVEERSAEVTRRYLIAPGRRH